MTQTNSQDDNKPAVTVAWRTGGPVHARKLNAGSELSSHLEAMIEHTDATLEASTLLQYRPDVGEAEEGVVYSAERNERIDDELIQSLLKGQELDFAELDELREKRLSCYAAVQQRNEVSRLYIRRQNPVKLASKTLFSAIAGGALDKLKQPVLAFDDQIDVVVEGTQIFILNIRGFESLFRDSDMVLEAAPKWVDELRDHVRISASGREELLAGVTRNSLHRRKLLSILDSSHIDKLTPKRIAKRMRKHNLDPAEHLVNDELAITKNNMDSILKLLNEDLYRGDFSDEHFAASGKTRFGS